MPEFAIKHPNGRFTDYALWKEILDPDELPDYKDVKKPTTTKVKK